MHAFSDNENPDSYSMYIRPVQLIDLIENRDY